LFAFADSQLGVKDNCEVLDHLKMCPSCSRIVDEHHALRGAVRRIVATITVPESLKRRIDAAVTQAGPPKSHAGRHAWRPAAIAASIVLIAAAAGTIFWTGWGRDDSVAKATKVAQSPPIKVERGQGAAKAIADVHNLCCAHAATHHSRTLPSNLAELGPAICSHFNHKIAALAPDLTAYGYRFESANFCGVQDKPGCEGGHILYVADKGPSRLSFFSVPRWDCLDKCSNRGLPSSDDCRKYEVDQPDGGKLAILAWHSDATTYICCGAEPFSRVEPMVKQIRTALVPLDAGFRLARLDSQP
jgi:hypothetical protein